MFEDKKAYFAAIERVQEILCKEVPTDEEEEEVNDLSEKISAYEEERNKILRIF